jgi:uncharacterized membrane protein YagU involved in acid resistance
METYHSGSKISKGIEAGLLAGIIFGIMMTVMSVPTPDGGEAPMMRLVAMVVNSTNLTMGWFYHLFNSALIGALFGAFYDDKTYNYKQATGQGALYGFIWWVIGGLILMPLFMGKPIFGPLLNEMMRPMALASFMGHLIYGVVLGAVYVKLRHAPPKRSSHRKVHA